MPQILLPSDQSWGTYRDILNDNATDVEQRLADIETGSISILHGDGPPGSGLGNVGDTYIDDLNKVVYTGKTGSGWPAGVSMAGLSNQGGWVNTTAYSQNDVVTYQNSVWVAKTNNIGNEPRELDTTNWQLFLLGEYWRGDWVTSIQYRRGHVVKHAGNVYRTTATEFTSTTTPDADTTNFMLVVSKGDQGDQGDQGIQGDTGDTGPPAAVWKGIYSGATAYVVNDVVIYRSKTWRAKTSTTGVEPTTSNTTQWEKLAGGYHHAGTWASSTVYREDDIVSYNNDKYRAKTNHTSSATTPDSDTTNYELFLPKGAQGPPGDTGDQGDPGTPGATGPGLASGGAAKDVIVKNSGTNYDTVWSTAPWARGAFRVAKSVDQTVGAAATGPMAVVMAWGVEVYDIDGVFASDVCTVPWGGLWHFGGLIAVTTGYAIDTGMYLFVSINGSTTLGHSTGAIRVGTISAVSSRAVFGVWSVTLNLTASDVIRMGVAHSGGMGSSRVVDAATSYFYGHYIGRTA